MIKYYIIGAIFLGISSLAGKVYYDQVQETKRVEAALVSLQKELKQQEASRLVLEASNAKAQLEANTYAQDLQKYQGREATVLAKPGLVGNKINASYIKTQIELSCLTGGVCEKD